MPTDNSVGAYQRVCDGFLRAVSDFSMEEYFRRGVLVGFSGGSDSVMLLHLMSDLSVRMGFALCAVHVNHMIRGKEADRDENLCKRIAEKLGVELIVYKKNVPEIAKTLSLGLEECARNIRYECFNKTVDERPDISCIVTAHNASDNAETFVFNVLRGGGSKAMCGIPPVRENILRPLIYSTKSDILRAVSEIGYEYACDSTNSDIEYSRNFIRSEIIPRMKNISPSPEKSIMRVCENIREDLSYIEEQSRRIIKEMNIVTTANRSDIADLHPAVFYRVLLAMHGNKFGFSKNSMEKKHIDKIQALLKEGKVNFSVDIPDFTAFVCERGKCFFEKRNPTDTKFNIPLSIGENILPSGAKLYLFKSINHEFSENAKNVYKLFIQEVLSFDTINLTLYARNKKDGDAYVYCGMTHKLKKLFNDKKLPISVRKIIPVICDEKGIIWTPMFGVRDDVQKNKNNINIYAYFCFNGGKNE